MMSQNEFSLIEEALIIMYLKSKMSKTVHNLGKGYLRCLVYEGRKLHFRDLGAYGGHAVCLRGRSS